MKERPLLITPHEAKALAAGTLTQIRRPVDPQPPSNTVAICESMSWDEWRVEVSSDIPGLEWELHSRIKCPWSVGDRLWTRETWAFGSTYGGEYPCVFYRADNTGFIGSENYPVRLVAAGGFGVTDGKPYASAPANCRWQSPVTMPRWASRATLIVADRRVEQNNDGIWLWVADVEVEK